MSSVVSFICLTISVNSAMMSEIVTLIFLCPIPSVVILYYVLIIFYQFCSLERTYILLSSVSWYS